jgi:type VI protein secretion system component VasK
MIATLLSELGSAVSAGTLAAADGDGGGATWLLALGPAGAGAAYFGVWRFYRNTHQSHSFERETLIEAQPATGDDAKVDEIKGTKKSGIKGDNRTNHRQRVQRFD